MPPSILGLAMRSIRSDGSSLGLKFRQASHVHMHSLHKLNRTHSLMHIELGMTFHQHLAPAHKACQGLVR